MDRELEEKTWTSEKKHSYEKKALVKINYGYQIADGREHQAFVRDLTTNEKVAWVFFKQISDSTIIKTKVFVDSNYNIPELHKRLELSLENCLMGQAVTNVLWPIHSDAPTQVRAAEDLNYLRLYVYSEEDDYIILHIKEL